ncbi:MAG: SemiSWEET transporter [Rhizomicrobium sp.]
MSAIAIIGTVAALCSTVSFVPQAWKIIRTRETKDISTGMYLLTVVGFAAWTSYGVLLAQWPLIAANGICFGLSGFILAMKLLPQPDKDAVADEIEKIAQ